MEDLKLPIIQIVGYKNSGKTTIIEKIVDLCENEEIKLGVLKHHGHGGYPVSIDEGTDTARFRKAGALVTGVEGEGMFQFQAQYPFTLEQLLKFYLHLPLDGLVIEGYKQAPYPKIVVLRSDEDIDLVHSLDKVIAIIYRNQYKQNKRTDFSVPSFSILDERSYLNFVLRYLKGVRNGS